MLNLTVQAAASREWKELFWQQIMLNLTVPAAGEFLKNSTSRLV
ncbi:hypothetical protein [Chitinophaga sancti]